MPYEDRHDADDESIASDDVGELDNGLVFGVKKILVFRTSYYLNFSNPQSQTIWTFSNAARRKNQPKLMWMSRQRT